MADLCSILRIAAAVSAHGSPGSVAPACKADTMPAGVCSGDIYCFLAHTSEMTGGFESGLSLALI
jgi:hypothetical protein